MLTYDQVCQLASKAGFSTVTYYDHLNHQAIAELIKLVAEDCIKTCDLTGQALFAEPTQSNIGTAQTCATAIRTKFSCDF